MRSVLSHPWDTAELQGDFIIYSQTLNTCREKGHSPLNTHRRIYSLVYSESPRDKKYTNHCKCRDPFVKNGQGMGMGRVWQMGWAVFWGRPGSPGDDASFPSILVEAVLSALRVS